MQQKIAWIAEEVPLHEDVRDWQHKLTAEEKNLLTQIFRFFTQGDIEVAKAYNMKYIPMFAGNPEVSMMLSTFAAAEANHVDAYSQLLDTLGIPEVEYKAFLEYDAMRDKYEYTDSFEMSSDPKDIAKSLAVYSAFTEGLQLFSSFAILLNFSRFNRMKGMSTIITWSIRDETLHVDTMIKVFRQFIKENRKIWTDSFKKELYEICRHMVILEDKFIDLAFEQGGIQGLEPIEVKNYVRYIADRRLLQLGLKPNYGIKSNPLEWLDWILNATEHANFFETRATEYTKAATTGTWEEAYG